MRSEAELIELINKKRQELEQLPSGNHNSQRLKELEDEISKLTAELEKVKPKRPKKVFLDECAG